MNQYQCGQHVIMLHADPAVFMFNSWTLDVGELANVIVIIATWVWEVHGVIFLKKWAKTAKNRYMVGSNQIKANSSTHTPLYGDGVAAWASLAHPPKNLSCAFFWMCRTVWLGFCLIAQVSMHCNVINTKLGVVDMCWLGVDIRFNKGPPLLHQRNPWH